MIVPSLTLPAGIPQILTASAGAGIVINDPLTRIPPPSVTIPAVSSLATPSIINGVAPPSGAVGSPSVSVPSVSIAPPPAASPSQFGGIVPTVLNAAAPVLNAANPITGGLLPGAGSLAPGVGSLVPGVGSLASGVGSLVPGVGSTLPGAVPAAVNTLNGVTEAVAGALPPALTGGIPNGVVGSAVVNPITSGVAGLLNGGLGSAVSNLAGAVTSPSSAPLPSGLLDLTNDVVYQAICQLGASVLGVILAAVTKVPQLLSLFPHNGGVASGFPTVPTVPGVPNISNVVGSVTNGLPLEKRQLLGGLTGGLTGGSATASSPASASASAGASTGAGGLLGGVTGTLGGLTGGPSSPLSGVTNTVGGLTGGSSGSSPLGAVTGALAPVTGAVSGVTGGSTNPLGSVGNTVTGATSGLTGGSSPLGGVTGGLTGGSSPVGSVVNTVGGATGGLTGGSSPLGAVVAPVGGVASGALGTVSQVASGVPGVGGIANNAVGAVTSTAGKVVPNLSPYYALNGIPGSDPVGGFSFGIIATLLSLLKKDPMSLFAPSFGTAALARRDVPDLAHRTAEFEIPELAKRQSAGSTSVPSLSQNIPGIGIGSLIGSGIPGVSPDIAALVGSIAKNIAIPGGNGFGSVTGSILSTLNGVIPNFVFQLPVVQDSVPTFSVLQLLASINPTKFKDLGTLTSLPALQQAANQISASDLAFLKTLPLSTDPSNLITTITSFTDNVLSCPGQVSNLKAAVAALSLRSLGLNVPGL